MGNCSVSYPLDYGMYREHGGLVSSCQNTVEINLRLSYPAPPYLVKKGGVAPVVKPEALQYHIFLILLD